MDRILIIGATGFIGQHLAKMLRQEYPQCEVQGTTRNGDSDGTFLHQVNTMNELDLRRIVLEYEPTSIINLTGLVGSSDWDELYRGNVKPSLNLFQLLSKIKISCRVLFIGSSAEYGRVGAKAQPVTEDYPTNPLSLYGLSKCCQTLAARYYSEDGVDIVGARLFNIIGKNISDKLAIGAFSKQIKAIKAGIIPPKMFVGNLSSHRDYLDIKDICSGILAVLLYGESGQIYNVCSGTTYSMRNILDIMITANGINVEIVTDNSKIQSNEVEKLSGSYEKLFSISGWSPKVPLNMSVERMFDD